MSGLYGGSGHGRSGLFGGGVSVPTAKHKHHGLLHHVIHGTAQFVGNLSTDVERATIGLPMGLVNLVRHPIRSIEQIGELTWQDWSPLFQGHPGKFLHQTFEHPLAPFLDVVSVATLGAGSGLRGAKALADAGIAKEGGHIARIAEIGKPVDVALHGPQGTVYRHLSGNPATRTLEQGAHSAIGRVAPNWRGGEYARLVQRDTARRGIAASHVSADVRSAFQGVFKAGATLTHQPQEFFNVVDETMHRNLGRFARTTEQEHVLSKVSKGGKVVRFTAAEGTAFIRKDAPKPPPIKTIEDVEQHLHSWGKRHTMRGTVKSTDVMLDARGNPLLVPDHNVNLLVQEAVNSTKLTRAIYHNPTRIWKWAVLTTPRFFVNNAVGNTFMAMNALKPGALAKGVIDTVQDTRGTRAALRAANEFDRVTKKALGHEGDVIDKWYLGPHKEGFGYEAAQSHQLYQKLEQRGADPRISKAVQIGEQGLFNFTHRVAEKGVRRIGIRGILTGQPEIKALRREGKSLNEAIDQASHDPAFRSRIQHNMDNVLGQYHYYNGLEQHLRKLVPFYGWDRAILRHGRTMTVTHPARTEVQARIGEQGVEETKKALGDIPSYMEGLIPLGGKKVLSTQGVNPYSTIPETIAPILAAVGLGKHKPGEALAMQLNPFLTGLIESTTGQSLLSGGKLPHHGGGILGQTAANVLEGIPQIRLGETLIKGAAKPHPNKRTGKTTPFLYNKDATAQVAALLGIPVKELNKGRAHELARKERGQKKGRKHKHGVFG
jgi:hypothetical protein